jgi:hypothetical protein
MEQNVAFNSDYPGKYGWDVSKRRQSSKKGLLNAVRILTRALATICWHSACEIYKKFIKTLPRSNF